MRSCAVMVVSLFALGCSATPSPSEDPGQPAVPRPVDTQHAGTIGPHGDHTPRHGGLVLMNGDVHYEIVLGREGHHQIWFSDAVRNDLPASLARGVELEISRRGDTEKVMLAIDDAGEAWRGTSRPLTGPDIVVKVRYTLQGAPHEVDVPLSPER